MKLLLFDLDGTLITTGGAGIRALDRAFEKLYGIKNAMKDIHPAGKTDPVIVREIFQLKLGQTPHFGEIQAACEAYLMFLNEEIDQSPGYRVMDGIRELLESFTSRPEIFLALGTGNLERGARIKLRPSELNDYFKWGGFGSDAEGRPDVLRMAMRRVEHGTGRRFPPRDVFVIGDTVLDVRAGKAVGATTVVVGCGHGKEEELRKERPDIYIPSFTEPEVLLDCLNGVNERFDH